MKKYSKISSEEEFEEKFEDETIQELGRESVRHGYENPSCSYVVFGEEVLVEKDSSGSSQRFVVENKDFPEEYYEQIASYIREQVSDNKFEFARRKSLSEQEFESFLEYYFYDFEEVDVRHGQNHISEVYKVIIDKPIGLEFRTGNVDDPAYVRKRIKHSLIRKGFEVEVLFTFSSSSKSYVFNLKNQDSSDDWRFVEGEEVVSYDEVVESVKKIFEEEKVVLKGFNKMIEGSLNYKTKEAGRKDGSGRIDRPW